MKNTKSYYLLLMLLIVLNISLNTYSTYSEPSDWAVDSIDVLLNNDFIQEEHVEDNKLKSNITREEFADLAVRLYANATGTGIINIEISDPFEDTDNPMILKAYSLGIVKGISNTLFVPSREITRQEIATMLLSTMNLLEIDTTIYEDALFDDMNLVADWAKDAVDFCAQEGILRGTGNNRLDPYKFTTWEQAVVLIHRVAEKYELLENLPIEEDAVETIAEISLEDYEIKENGYVLPKETTLLAVINEEAGLHLRLTAKGSEGNRDLKEKTEKLFEVLGVNGIPAVIREEFKQIIEDSWTVFNAPRISEPIIRVLEGGKRIELSGDLDVRVSIYTPFLNTNNEAYSIDSYVKLPTGYMVLKESKLVISTDSQRAYKLEAIIYGSQETEEIINQLNDLFLVLRVNKIPSTTIEKIEKDIYSNWDYNKKKPGIIDPTWVELPNGDQLVYSSGGFVQVKIFSY